MNERHPIVRQGPSRYDADDMPRKLERSHCPACSQPMHFPIDPLLIGRTMQQCGCNGGKPFALPTRRLA